MIHPGFPCDTRAAGTALGSDFVYAGKPHQVFLLSYYWSRSLETMNGAITFVLEVDPV